MLSLRLGSAVLLTQIRHFDPHLFIIVHLKVAGAVTLLVIS